MGLFKKIKKKIKKTAKKIGKSKLVKAVGAVTKSVVSAKFVTGLGAAALAIFPPTAAIGVPALAAFGAANAAVKAIGKGKKLKNTASAAQHTLAKAAQVKAALGA